MLARVRALLDKWRPSSISASSLGRKGERAAARYLKRLGYRIVARSQRDLFGELDLIAVDGEVVVFVEVKTRSSNAKGHPAEAVDFGKQARLTRQALAFLKRHHLLEYQARFDIVAIYWPSSSRRPAIEHLIHAFEPVGCDSFFS